MQKRLMIVDSVKEGRDLLISLLSPMYQLYIAGSGKEAIETMREHKNDVAGIVLTLNLTDMSGIAVIDAFDENHWTGIAPFLVMSLNPSEDEEQDYFDKGVVDYIRIPCRHSILKRRISNVVKIFEYKEYLEEQVSEQTASLQEKNAILQEKADELAKINQQIIFSLCSMVESRDMESGEHIIRVQEFTRLLANEMMKHYPEYKLTPEQVEMISTASAMHDIGKIAIPDHILLKPGKLDSQEYECMKEHAQKGYELLLKIKDLWSEEYAQISLDICYYHHERYNGEGYPLGLKGDDIPIAAQMVSIADVYDALVHERCYKAAYPKEKAFRMIMDGNCGSFSPKLLSCFEHVRAEFEQLVDDKNI